MTGCSAVYSSSTSRWSKSRSLPGAGYDDLRPQHAITYLLVPHGHVGWRANLDEGEPRR